MLTWDSLNLVVLDIMGKALLQIRELENVNPLSLGNCCKGRDGWVPPSSLWKREGTPKVIPARDIYFEFCEGIFFFNKKRNFSLNKWKEFCEGNKSLFFPRARDERKIFSFFGIWRFHTACLIQKEEDSIQLVQNRGRVSFILSIWSSMVLWKTCHIFSRSGL